MNWPRLEVTIRHCRRSAGKVSGTISLNYCLSASTVEPDSLYLRAFASGLDAVLDDYREQIVRAEEMILTPSGASLIALRAFFSEVGYLNMVCRCVDCLRRKYS